MATQNKSMVNIGKYSTETWKKVGTFLLGVGLLAAYHFAEDENGTGGLKSTFDEIKRDLRKMGETIQGKVSENPEATPSRRTRAARTNKKGAQSAIALSRSHAKN